MARAEAIDAKPKVLLLAPPATATVIRDNYCCYSAKADYYWPPIDLLLQSGFLSEKFEPVLLDAVAEKLSPDRALARAKEIDYAAVLSLTGYLTWDDDLSFFEKLKTNNPAPVFISGDVVLYQPEDLLERAPVIDGVLLDFSTEAFVEYLAGRRGVIDNLIYRWEGEPVIGERRSPSTHFSVPLPRHDLFRLDKYRISTAISSPFSTVVSGLGCNRGCGYCVGSLTAGRLRSIENMMEEMALLKKLGVRELYFHNPNFSFNRSYLEEFCRALIKYDGGFVYSCNCHLEDVDAPTLELLKKSGCHTIMFGIESADPRALAAFGRKLDRERAAEILTIARKLGISTFGYFMLGLPGEDEQSVKQTIALAKSLPLDYASFNIPTPTPGTKMWRDIQKQKKELPLPFGQDRSEVSRSASEKISDERLAALYAEAYRSFYLRPRYIARLLIRRSFYRRLPQTIADGLAIAGKFF